MRMGAMRALVLAGMLVAPTGETSADGGRAAATAGPELAQAFTAALNGHDADRWRELFGEAGGRRTVEADRSAWNRYELRLWAEQQFRSNIRVQGFDYRPTEDGATWTSLASRDDWSGLGARALALSNR